MSTELVTVNQVQDLATENWTAADLLALKNTIAKDCSLSQLRIFVAAAKRLGLDPFARQIVPIVQGDKMTPQVTIDGFRLIAERTGKYAGQLGPFWCGPDGEWREVWLSNDPPTACKVGVLRRDFDQPMWGVARTAAYKSGTPTWGKMPDVMIAKVAESLALRKAFPQELGGVYSDDEMEQARADEPQIQAVDASAPSGPTRADLDTYAREHGIAPRMVSAGLKKYAGDVERTLKAMRIYVEERDKRVAPAGDDDDNNITFEVDETPASLEQLPVGTRGM